MLQTKSRLSSAWSIYLYFLFNYTSVELSNSIHDIRCVCTKKLNLQADESDIYNIDSHIKTSV